jgi:class 3 adenylate cyclase
MRPFMDSLVGIDVRSVLSTVSAPALVIHPTDDIACPIDNGRWLADHIPGAQFVEIPGEHVTAVVTQRFMDETEGFLTGNHRGVITDRLLATVMFSDIVGSTTRAVSLGDRRWRELLDQHDVIVERLVDTHRGKVVKNVGDGMLATFDGPARAVSCGSAIHAELQPLDINVRVGLHTGEIETRGTDVSGIAVHIGERVASLARPGEVLVSRTVVDLVAGSGLSFDDRGEHELKGVPGTWRLFAVAS